MKNLIFILLLFTGFVSIGQSSGNDLNKYIRSKNQYGTWPQRLKSDSVTDIPQDTLYSKDGIARKGNRFFTGNGVFWREIFPSSSSVTYGIDSITYSNNLLCQWKTGISTCYTVIGGGGVDSVTLVGSNLCQWKNGVATCYIITGNVLGSFVDSVVVTGNQLCQWITGVSTCYTINNTNNGIDSVTFYGNLLCQWKGGIPTCYVIPGSISATGLDSITLHGDTLCQWVDGAATCYPLGRYFADASMSLDSTEMNFYDRLGNLLKSVDLYYKVLFSRGAIVQKDTTVTINSKVKQGVVLYTDFDISAPNWQQVMVVGNTTTKSAYMDSAVTTSDALIHGLTVGRGASGVITNSVLGSGAGGQMTSAANNTIVGSHAGDSLTTGTQAVLIGTQAGQSMKTDGRNTFIGYQAGRLTSVGNNTFVGLSSGISNTTGTRNVFLGGSSGILNTTGYSNTSLGFLAGQFNTTGSGNTSVGSNAARLGNLGYGNTAIGDSSLYQSVAASFNTVVGFYAGLYMQGNKNIAIGDSSLTYIFNQPGKGDYNIGIGHNASVRPLAAPPANNFISHGIAIGDNAIADAYQLALSDSTTSMKFKNLDSATGTAPSVVGRSGDGLLHIYATPSGGGGGVSSVGSGFGLTGGPITTSGTLSADTSASGLGSKFWKLTGLNAGPTYPDTTKSIGTSDATPFIVKTWGREVSRWDSAGNFGYGTKTPTKQFHVVGTAGPFARFERSTSSTGGNFVDLYNPDATDGNTSFLTFTTLTTNTGAADQLVARIGAVYNIHDNATRAASLSFFTANGGATSERMRITPSGGLLLGTTTELASSLATFTSTTKGILIPRLTTTQQTAVSSPATGLAVINTDSSSAPTIYDGTRWKKLLFSLDAASTYAPISGGAYRSTTGTTGDIDSYSATNTPSRIAAVATGYLLGSQGTSTLPAWLQAATLNTSLTTPLHIGNTTSGGTLTLQSTSNATKGKILFGTSAYDEVNDRLGIGVTSPQSIIEAVATTTTIVSRATSNSGFAAFRAYNDQNSSARALAMTYTGSSYGGPFLTSGLTGEQGAIATTGAFPLGFGTNSTQRMTILSTGNIGIGVTSPTSLLHTAGSFAAGYVAKTANYTATISDYTINCTANTFQVTLPTAVGITGRMYVITNSGAGTITIGTTSSQTFTNVVATPTTLTMAAVGAITVQSDGANWLRLTNL